MTEISRYKKTADKLKELGNAVTHLVCYSGGHTSAKVAMNVAKMYPDDKIIILNHDINDNVEDADIKRFKKDVAEKLELPISYANYEGIQDSRDIPDQFDVCIKIKGFKFNKGTELCTYNLKTKPFYDYLAKHFPVDKETGKNSNLVIYYGFDKEETKRIQRRASILGEQGYFTDFPMALWEKEEVDDNIVINSGIRPPLTYERIDVNVDYGSWKHANCVGCLKAGKQHWYAVYCVRPDIWEKAKATESKLDHSIIKDVYLEELEPLFLEMKEKGIPPTEHIHGATFWAMVRKVIHKNMDVFEIFEIEKDAEKPCECVF